MKRTDIDKEIISDEMKFRQWVITKLTMMEANTPGKAAPCQLNNLRLEEAAKERSKISDKLDAVADKVSSGSTQAAIIGSVVSSLIVGLGFLLKL